MVSVGFKHGLPGLANDNAISEYKTELILRDYPIICVCLACESCSTFVGGHAAYISAGHIHDGGLASMESVSFPSISKRITGMGM